MLQGMPTQILVKVLPLATVAALSLAACGGRSDVEDSASGPSPTPGAESSVEVTMADADGAEVGTVRLSADGEATLVEVDVTGLEPGFHGFHIHDVGRCEADAPDGPFTTAMGHYVGEGEGHGDHDGDMPSLFAKADGTATLTASLDTFTLEELQADDGAAVMIHAGADNFANVPDRYTSSASGQPGSDDMTTSTGDAGARVACGVIGAGSP